MKNKKIFNLENKPKVKLHDLFQLFKQTQYSWHFAWKTIV